MKKQTNPGHDSRIETNKALQILKSNLRKQQAIRILEYEDKNWLTNVSPKVMNERLQELDTYNLQLINRIDESVNN